VRFVTRVYRQTGPQSGRPLKWGLKMPLDISLIDFQEAQEFRGGVGEAGAAAGDDVEVAGDIELADFEFLQGAVFDFPVDAHARNNGDAHTHLYEALDALDGRHFHGHIERGAMAGEEFDDPAAEGRFDNVGDEIFLAELFDLDVLFSGEWMLGWNDEGKFVFQDFRGQELRIARHEGNGAEIESVVDDFVGNIAGEHAVEPDLDARVSFAEAGEGGEQGMDGALIDTQGKFAALEAFEFHQAFFDFVTEVEKAFSIFPEQGAGIGKADRACATDEEGLAEGILELTDGQADSGLGAIEALGGAREAAFSGNRQENLQFT
jgi:hypothetical protein